MKEFYIKQLFNNFKTASKPLYRQAITTNDDNLPEFLQAYPKK